MNLTYKIGEVENLPNGVKREIKVFVNEAKNEVATATLIKDNNTGVNVVSVKSHTTERFSGTTMPNEYVVDIYDTENIKNILKDGTLAFIGTLVESMYIPDRTYLGTEIFEKQEEEFIPSGTSDGGQEIPMSEITINVNVLLNGNETIVNAKVELLNDDMSIVLNTTSTNEEGYAGFTTDVLQNETTTYNVKVSGVVGYEDYIKDVSVNPNDTLEYFVNASFTNN